MNNEFWKNNIASYKFKKNRRRFLNNLGLVIVGRNPFLHPGYIRILIAVNEKNLSHHVNTIVFPTRGTHPHYVYMSGMLMVMSILLPEIQELLIIFANKNLWTI